MPRKNYIKVSKNIHRSKLIKHINYLQNKQKAYDEFLQHNNKVLRISKTLKNENTVDFINKYHKNKYHWHNKVAYLAGLIDGEGHLKIERWGTIRLVIGMTHKDTIYWIKNTFGGKVYNSKCKSGKPLYYWTLNQGKELFYLLLLCIPFLITKKKILVKAFHKLVERYNNLNFRLTNGSNKY